LVEGEDKPGLLGGVWWRKSKRWGGWRCYRPLPLFKLGGGEKRDFLFLGDEGVKAVVGKKNTSACEANDVMG